MTNQPKLVKKSDLRVDWDLLPHAKEWGTIRGAYNGIEATSCLANLIVLPFGQSSPHHTFTGEHVVYQVQGSVEWMTGLGDFVLTAGDLFFLPANVEYSFRNIGPEDAYFLDIAARADDWPPTIHYLDGGEVSHDDYGNLYDEAEDDGTAAQTDRDTSKAP